ncbi:hypothetical protein OQJ18_02800 [Fluoribacter dumoffii]|uniref:hypothetical protein n=1 Tax=Fluoribacter dumoffii TaxID=463 RepID=UPI0022441F66|nr:hypothetical protein [Fluoribacter dumoffii]MCW8418982.1 hypothetical protein [Fluoribacter dumoffii]MCW8453174.1 hypothetical protein [Fluoribacter dumoffii]MCW8459605.1 hypothetical protein [Fluoribacter dumoffii]MCW8482965.1 hypothetical protein [Fluoribacter dumoffii]
MFIDEVRGKVTIADILFGIRYLPHAAVTTAKYSLYGACVGFLGTYLFSESLKKFAAENPEAVNLDGKHVQDDEQFLKFSRHSQFSHYTPPISEMIPIYSTGLGACAGAFFGLSKSCSEFSVKLKADRELRRLDMV